MRLKLLLLLATTGFAPVVHSDTIATTDEKPYREDRPPAVSVSLLDEDNLIAPEVLSCGAKSFPSILPVSQAGKRSQKGELLKELYYVINREKEIDEYKFFPDNDRSSARYSVVVYERLKTQKNDAANRVKDLAGRLNLPAPSWLESWREYFDRLISGKHVVKDVDFNLECVRSGPLSGHRLIP